MEDFPNRYPVSAGPATPSEADANAQVKPAEDQEFNDLKDKVTKLANNWRAEIDETLTRRELRKMNVDVLAKRRSGEFKADEGYIPIHVIDDNIKKEQAQYIAYLTTSRNSAIFKTKKQYPENYTNCQAFEEWFTKLERFPGWEIPFFKTLDGTQLHGTDFVEVVWDSDKPGHFAHIQLAHENVWFPTDTEDIQRSPIVVRNCMVTKDELLAFDGVNVEEVDKLFQDTAHIGEIKSMQPVQKVFYKKPKEKLVYVCWMSYEKSSGFIRGPKPLSFGRVKFVQQPATAFGGPPVQQKIDIYETQYPIEPLPYLVSEDGKLRNIIGRAKLDEYIQEATSSLVSSIVNAWHRASQVYASLENPATGGSPEQLQVLQAGKIYTQALKFFHQDYPDENGMVLVNALITQNKAETGQVNYAVGNRTDYASRKTAKEISSAESQAALLGAVQVTLFSIFLRNVFTRDWSIAQSQAQQGLIPVPQDITPDMLQVEYELFSAGDSEVLKRQETKQNLMQAWPVVSQTPAAMAMLEDLLALLFPQNASKYIMALRQADPTKVVTGLATILASVMKEHPEVIPVEGWDQTNALLGLANQITQKSLTNGEVGQQQQPAQMGNGQEMQPA